MAKTTHADENITLIKSLYKALANGDSENVAKHLATDLEWWFHGPPQCQHMRRVLTGESAKPEFQFEPRCMAVIDDERVIAEGWEGAQAYWVHVWTLKSGAITQLREYFNTWLIVRDLRPNNNGWENGLVNRKGTLWQSQQAQAGLCASRSMPGLVLAI